MGQARAAAGDLAGACEAFALAARLAPDDAGVAANHALALLRAGDPGAAVAEARRAATLDPGLGAAQANLGHALLAAGAAEEAVGVFARLVSREPANADAWHGMAIAQRALGRLGAGLAAVDRAVALAPLHAPAVANQGMLRLDAGDPPAAVESFAAAAAAEPDTLAHASNALLAMVYDPAMAPEAVARVAADWGAGLQKATPRRTLQGGPKGPPLRVGVVSADLWRHPVAWLGAQALLHLDPSRCSAVVYDTGAPRDDLNAEFRARLAWREVSTWTDAALADQVAADGVDLLIDLAGHTAGGRPRLFAHKPAPRQAYWLGHVATTGLSTIDAVLMDAWHAPPGAEALFTEPLVHVAGGRFAYSPPPFAPEPSRQGGPVTFGCFHALAKLNPEVARLWARVLDAAPGSRLLIRRTGLAEPWLRERVTALFRQAGVEPARLDLEPATDHAALLASYARVDVALDPFPFSGGATTAEALWMGVPVITLPGAAAPSRQSLAMLSAIDRPEWIASDESTYVSAAIAALDPAENRGRLRDQVAASPFGSTVRLARSLETVFDAICAAPAPKG
jgi:predicted O-linked N-acetylglucosamine transferase (SPINDLY family)